MTIKCSTCGTENPTDAKFCEQCRASISEKAKTTNVLSTKTIPIAPSPVIQVSSSSKNEANRLGITVTVLVVVGVAYFALQSSPQPTTPSPVVVPIPTSTPAPVANPTPSLVSPRIGAILSTPSAIALPAPAPEVPPAPVKLADSVSPQETAATSTPVSKSSDISNMAIEVLALYPLADIKQHVGSIMDAVKDANDAEITKGIDTLKHLVLPARGDRKAARAANENGLAKLKIQSYDEAALLFISAIKADPSDQEIINNLAFALEKGNRLVEARAAALCSLALAPMRSSAWANLATILATEGKEETAVASFLLTYKFSQNQQKTIEYLQKLVQENAEARVRDAASKAIARIGKTKEAR